MPKSRQEQFMRFALACFAAIVTVPVAGAFHADDGVPYEQEKIVGTATGAHAAKPRP